MRWILLLLVGRVQSFSARRQEARSLSYDSGSLFSPPLLEEELIEWSSLLRSKEECLALHSHGLIDYCSWIHSLEYYSIPLIILWVLVLLWLLNDTAETYFVPPLRYWSARLHLSPCMAGATLVAAGNGAPDLVMTALAPTTIESLHIVICDTICILCVAGGAVLFMRWRIAAGASQADQKDSKWATLEPLDARTYVASAAWLCCALVYVMYLLALGQLTLSRCAVMPALYIGFLLTLASLDDGIPFEVEIPEGPVPPLEGLSLPKESSFLGKLYWALTMPTYVVRWMLIPPSDLYWDRCRRIFVSVSPIALLIFIAGTTGLSFQWYVSSTPAILILFSAICLSTSLLVMGGDGPETPRLYPLTTLLAKISSVLLLLAIARELTACCKTAAFFLGVSRFVLESTIVPWGNSLGDLVTAIAMVRQGQTTAAATALFAAPLFNVLLSGGLTLILATSNGRVVFEEGSASQMQATAGAFLACIMLCGALIFEKQVQPFGAASLAGLYIIFLVGVLVVELRSS